MNTVSTPTRPPVDRSAVVASAIASLEAGSATIPSQLPQDPEALADQIRQGAESGSSARRFAAFKLAQRVGGVS